MSSNPSEATVPEVIPGQLSLRAYFVAHAPAAPASFKPQLPEVIWPEELEAGGNIATVAKKAIAEGWSRDRAIKHCAHWPITGSEQLIGYLTQYHIAVHQQEENEKNEPLERALQWPLYWADTMIERLNK